MHYVYALIFAILISPIESWLASLSGFLFNHWDRLWTDLATGALFANAALIAMEALLRLQLLSDSARKARPTLVKVLALSAATITFVSVVVAVLMWQANSSYTSIQPEVYWVAIGFCVLALVIMLASIRLEGGAKKALRQVARKRGKAGEGSATAA